ncbi:hypothetical protein L249_0765 [Ophiocordyceps polyrhachis-furcata BCC 54312]|uniref:Uncharacterized protein n=1 Tax=Ophiocordyceps polyrhachis-furcata BCC 54312 TaxID=1330021 RepID=A0A367LF97_9HYPO|nr:hypothetical protein L249_0765 [Ophiocordyceps polyrhachis-furcata BCC 54312]
MPRSTYPLLASRFWLLSSSSPPAYRPYTIGNVFWPVLRSGNNIIWLALIPSGIYLLIGCALQLIKRYLRGKNEKLFLVGKRLVCCWVGVCVAMASRGITLSPRKTRSSLPSFQTITKINNGPVTETKGSEEQTMAPKRGKKRQKNQETEGSDDDGPKGPGLPNVTSLVGRPVGTEEMTVLSTLAWSGRTELKIRPTMEYFRMHSIFELWHKGGKNLGHLGVPVYVELAFRQEVPDQAPSSVQEEMSDTTPLEYFVSRFLGPRERSTIAMKLKVPRVTCIPAELAHPQGYFFKQLIEVHRPEYYRAIIVAVFGQRNPRMCGHCIRSWSTTTTCHREHVLSPFHECVSMPGMANFTCANCIWNGTRAATCDWREVPGYADGKEDGEALQMRGCFAGGEGVADLAVAYEDYMNPRVSPRLAKDMPNPFVDDGLQPGENNDWVAIEERAQAARKQ